MRITVEDTTLRAEVIVPREPTVCVALSSCGLILWLALEADGQRWSLPLPRRSWEGVREAVEGLLAQDVRLAHINNTVQALVDSIDGPGGEA